MHWMMAPWQPNQAGLLDRTRHSSPFAPKLEASLGTPKMDGKPHDVECHPLCRLCSSTARHQPPSLPMQHTHASVTRTHKCNGSSTSILDHLDMAQARPRHVKQQTPRKQATPISHSAYQPAATPRNTKKTRKTNAAVHALTAEPDELRKRPPETCMATAAAPCPNPSNSYLAVSPPAWTPAAKSPTALLKSSICCVCHRASSK